MGLFDSWNEKKKRKEKLDKLAEKIAEVGKDLEDDKVKLKFHQDKLYKMLIKKYGSEDKIPAYNKKYLTLK